MEVYAQYYDRSFGKLLDERRAGLEPVAQSSFSDQVQMLKKESKDSQVDAIEEEQRRLNEIQD